MLTIPDATVEAKMLSKQLQAIEYFIFGCDKGAERESNFWSIVEKVSRATIA
jgi:hypothetical protein